jgi:hypothetical protein
MTLKGKKNHYNINFFEAMEYQSILLLIPGLLFIPLAAYGFNNSIGIAANGQIVNANYTVTQYEVNTDMVLGKIQINSVSTNPPKTDASLQLNAVLHVITTNGTIDYWVQNVLSFANTNYQTAYFINNVWQVSGTTDINTLCAHTHLLQLYLCKHLGVYYKESDPFAYQLPFSSSVVLTEKVIPEKGVQLEFMHIEQANLKVYDNHLIPIPDIVSAYFLVTQNPSSEAYYDVEFVWGGFGGGSSAYFTSMDSLLNLQYLDDKTNAWKPFTSYIPNGLDTGETAQNIYSTIEPNGWALVELGNGPNQNSQTPPVIISPSQTTSQPTPQSTQSDSMPFPITGYVYLEDTSLRIPYNIENGNVEGMWTDPMSKSITIPILTTNYGSLNIDLPSTLIEPNSNGFFTTLVDGISSESPVSNSPDGFAVRVDFPAGAKQIEIFGSQVAIPEFGTLTPVIFLVSVILTMVISTKLRSERT